MYMYIYTSMFVYFISLTDSFLHTKYNYVFVLPCNNVLAVA